MASREDESVTIWPDRIFRIKSQKLLPQHVYNRCHGHGGSWMTGVRLLDGIHAESPDCIYREGVDVRHTPKVRPGAGGNKCNSARRFVDSIETFSGTVCVVRRSVITQVHHATTAAI